MPGASGSGRRQQGETLFADALHQHLSVGSRMLRDLCRGGLTPEVERWIEASQSLVLRQEIVASRTALARALLEGDDVTPACLRLATQHVERFGPLVRLSDAA